MRCLQGLSNDDASKAVTGCYRQKDGVIYVSECSSSESQSEQELSTESDKLILINSDQSLLEFRLHAEENRKSFQSPLVSLSL